MTLTVLNVLIDGQITGGFNYLHEAVPDIQFKHR